MLLLLPSPLAVSFDTANFGRFLLSPPVSIAAAAPPMEAAAPRGLLRPPPPSEAAGLGEIWGLWDSLNPASVLNRCSGNLPNVFLFVFKVPHCSLRGCVSISSFVALCPYQFVSFTTSASYSHLPVSISFSCCPQVDIHFEDEDVYADEDEAADSDLDEPIDY